MGLFKTDATKIGFIIIAIIFMFGSFCIYDVNRMLNLTSTVIGYFKHTTDVVKVSDFEYDVEQLLFTNSGANENEYFGEVITDPVEGFDKTKKYAIEINGNNCGYINQNLGYVNANFMNTFYSTNNTVLLTDNLNIKVNFYKDGTKIVLITNNGEKAVKLWSSYIQKNGFKIKIVEDNFNSMIEVDNIPSYTVNLYVDGEIYQTLSVNFINISKTQLPLTINNFKVIWKDAEGKTYETLPLKNINLYGTIQKELIFDIKDATEFKIDELYGSMKRYSVSETRIFKSDEEKELVNKLMQNPSAEIGISNLNKFNSFKITRSGEYLVSSPDYYVSSIKEHTDYHFYMSFIINTNNEYSYVFSFSFFFEDSVNIGYASIKGSEQITLEQYNAAKEQISSDFSNESFTFDLTVRMF